MAFDLSGRNLSLVQGFEAYFLLCSSALHWLDFLTLGERLGPLGTKCTESELSEHVAISTLCAKNKKKENMTISLLSIIVTVMSDYSDTCYKIS